MICGPLFCCFWVTLVDAKKVIDVITAGKEHIIRTLVASSSSSLSYVDNLEGLV